MAIFILIGIMIAIVVGINLIPYVVTTTNTETFTEITTSSSTGLAGVLIIVFATVLILGAVAYMGFKSDDSPSFKEPKKKIKKIIGNTKEFILKIEKQSEYNKEYIQNLESYLPIKTKVATNKLYPDLYLNDYNNELIINEYEYDWYIVDHNKENTIFKIFGIHKENKNYNVKYELGIKDNKVYLTKE